MALKASQYVRCMIWAVPALILLAYTLDKTGYYKHLQPESSVGNVAGQVMSAGADEKGPEPVDFHYTEGDYHLLSHAGDQLSEFDNLLFTRWKAAMAAGYFRYSLEGANRVRELPGKFKFILQLNELRGYERRKPDNITKVNTDFDPDKFNFNKVKAREVLFYLCNGDKSRHPVMINVSPLDTGHVLLVPNITHNLPQRLTQTATEIALHSILLSTHRGMLVGFNSLCALASVNHLHLHAWYTEQPLVTHTARVERVCGFLYKTVDLPVPAFVLQLHGDTTTHLSSMVLAIAEHLQQNEIAHNVAMVRGTCFHDNNTNNSQVLSNGVGPALRDDTTDGRTVRVYIWPRKSATGVKNDLLVPFNIAVAELAGQIPFYVTEEFDGTTEEEVVARLEDQQLPRGEFEELTKTICDKFPHLFNG